MRITIAAIGTRLEPWASQAFESYEARLPRYLKPQLAAIPPARRAPGMASAGLVDREGERLLRHVEPGDFAVALDERGLQWSSPELAGELESWLQRQPRVTILIGGPDGLSDACRKRANRLWSLSRLTFPHALVRVLLIEQIYRAWTLVQGHPYHRQ